MSHYEMTPRAGFGSAVWARAQRRAVAERCGEGEKLERWDAVEFCAKSTGGLGGGGFCGCGGRPGEGLGTRGRAREAEGERRRNPWFWSLVLGIISKEELLF